jgi:hypothetical protein
MIRLYSGYTMYGFYDVAPGVEDHRTSENVIIKVPNYQLHQLSFALL